jgi:hypothetical protein
MKYSIQLLLLFLLATAAASAGVIVNFGGVDQPYNIGQAVGPQNTLVQNSYAIDDVTFSYEPVIDAVGQGALCGFDAGNGGLQPSFGCAGAQVDNSGITGTTDGSLIMRFANPVYSLHFGFGFLTHDGLPSDQNFNVTGIFSYAGDPFAFASVDGSDPLVIEDNLMLASAGDFSFTTGNSEVPFDLAVLYFSPTAVVSPVTNLLNIGQTNFQIFGDSVSYDEAPEPETLTMLGFGVVAIGASVLIKRKK